ncbi:ROK family protein [Streptacidiphilus fuscans]|uniref:ROK family protein n=1 Tax=Streptacidiphilus fuscans TaxID=2789292 RepID=A0A931FIA3_9ACTN|nr:ROK family protein [Streptacidiphilus fuscans]MBF9072696.1 ROK family protein [Streptacidiphilus fuscans]
MRRQNLAVILSTVAGSGPLSRAAVAKRVGLTRTAVSSLVDELLGARLLVEGDVRTNGKVGRPGRELALNDRGPAGLGLEVGPAHLGVCVVDLRGATRVWHRVPARNRSRPAEQVLAELVELAADGVREAEAAGLEIQGSVLAVPGVLGPAHDTVEHAPNLGWRDVVPARHWPGQLRAPELENEANLGALAERWCGAQTADTLVHISAETGIGAALVIGGRLFRGAGGYAGELGHVPVHHDGPRCSCGARGCLEQYAGARAVLRAAGIRGTHRDPVATLAERARDGHAPTLAALAQAGEAFGTALTSAVNLFDPAAVVLGGAYAELSPWLLPAMADELAARVRVRPWDPDVLRPSSLGRSAPLLGAAHLTVRRILTDPARLGE